VSRYGPYAAQDVITIAVEGAEPKRKDVLACSALRVSVDFRRCSSAEDGTTKYLAGAFVAFGVCRRRKEGLALDAHAWATMQVYSIRATKGRSSP